jgi:hypothetical protein
MGEAYERTEDLDRLAPRAYGRSAGVRGGAGSPASAAGSSLSPDAAAASPSLRGTRIGWPTATSSSTMTSGRVTVPAAGLGISVLTVSVLITAQRLVELHLVTDLDGQTATCRCPRTRLAAAAFLGAHDHSCDLSSA